MSLLSHIYDRTQGRTCDLENLERERGREGWGEGGREGGRGNVYMYMYMYNVCTNVYTLFVDACCLDDVGSL